MCEVFCFFYRDFLPVGSFYLEDWLLQVGLVDYFDTYLAYFDAVFGFWINYAFPLEGFSFSTYLIVSNLFVWGFSFLFRNY